MESRLITQICEYNTPTVTAYSMELSEHGKAYQRLIEMRALVKKENSSTALCPGCFDVHALEVESLGNGRYRGYCQDEGYLDIPAKDLVIHELSFTWLLQQISMAVGLFQAMINLHHEPIINEKFWYLGNSCLSQMQFQLYFVRGLKHAGVMAEFRNYLYRNQNSLPVFIFTTTSLSEIYCTLPKRVVLLNLLESMSFCSGRFQLDETLLVRKLKGEPDQHITEGLRPYFSPDFRHATVNGIKYTFSKKQAAIMEKLIEEDGFAHKSILSLAADTEMPPKEIFRYKGKYHPAWMVLIVPDGNGYYRCPLAK